MNIKTLRAVEILISLIIVSVIVLFAYSFFTNAPPRSEYPPLDELVSMKYDSCYDASSGRILLFLSRYQDTAEISGISAFFTSRGEEKSFEIEIPENKQTRTYSFLSENPEEISVVVRTLEKTCNNTKTLLLQECDENSSNVAVDFSFLGESDVSIVQQNQSKSDSVAGKDKNKFSICSSDWKCENWEECVSGIQKRQCADSNNCLIPTDIPDFTKKCRECIEDWLCSWTECSGGYTFPTCKDMNKCGTEFSKPSRIECIKKPGCIPDIICESWTECMTDYRLAVLSLNKFMGIKSRVCRDDNSCISPVVEEKKCTLAEDIEITKSNVNNKDYLNIIEKRSGRVLAKLEYKEDFLKIDFSL